MKFSLLLFLLCSLMILAGCKSDDAMLAARQSLRDSQTPFSRSAFTKSIADGDSEKVSLFLTGGMDTELGQQNSNALLVAVDSNQQDIVQKLLDHGVDVDPKGFAGSPLCVAAEKGFTEIAKILIAKDANIDFLQGNSNPLMLASATGHNETIQVLLDAGADVDIQGESTKLSPLMLAARNGHEDSVKLLLAKGANTQLVDHGKHKALEFAIFKGRANIVKLLVEAKDYNSEKDSTAALVMAISMKRIASAKEIIKCGANLNDEYGSLPLLSWAIFNNYTDGAELLIKSGADLNKADKDEMIPLDYALTAKNEKIVKIIRSAKPEVSKE